MPLKTKEIQTGVDRLVHLIMEKGRIPLSDAAKSLNLPERLVDEWAHFLVQRGVIELKYILTKPVLFKKNLSQQELKQSQREFESKREGFLRKTEAFITEVKRHKEYAQELQREFNLLKSGLKRELKFDDKELGHINELGALLKERSSLHIRLSEEQQRLRAQLEGFRKELMKTYQEYEKLEKSVASEMSKLSQGLKFGEDFKDKAALLYHEAEKIQVAVQALKKELGDSALKVQESRKELLHMEHIMEHLRKDVAERKRGIDSLLALWAKKSEELVAKEEQILKKIQAKQNVPGNLEAVERLATQLSATLSRGAEIEKLVSSVVTGFNELETELRGLLTETRALEVGGGKADSEIETLNKRFEEIRVHKEEFEKRLKRLQQMLSK